MDKKHFSLLPPFIRKFGMIPESYKIAMTYEEQLLFLCKYCEDLGLEVENIKTALTTIEASIETLHNSILVIDDTLNTHSEILTELQTQYGALNTQVQTNTNSISSINQELTTQSARITTNTTNIQSLSGEVTGLSNTVLSLSDIINNGYIINALGSDIDLYSPITLSEGYYNTMEYQVLDTTTTPETPMIAEYTLFYYSPTEGFKVFPNSDSINIFYEIIYLNNGTWQSRRLRLTDTVDSDSTPFEIPTALSVYEAIRQGGSGIETISTDSNVWELEEGIYFVENGVKLYYDNQTPTSTSYTIKNDKSLLFITKRTIGTVINTYTYILDSIANSLFATFIGQSADLGSNNYSGAYFKLYDYSNPPQLEGNMTQVLGTSEYRYPSEKAVADYVEEKTTVRDTGWVDLSNYLGASGARIRSGFPPEARRIGNQVYWRGEIYCYSSQSSKTLDLLQNLPLWVRPSAQYSNSGCKYESTAYNIFASPGGRVAVSESSNISSTSEYNGYQLSNLWGYFVDTPFIDNEAPESTTLLMHFNGNLNNEVTGDQTGITGTYATTTGKFQEGQITSASANDIFLSGFSPDTSKNNWGIGFWSYDSGSLWNGATIYARHLTTNEYVPLINIGSYGIITPGNDAMTFSNGQSTQRSIYQYQYNYVAIQMLNGNEFHGYYNGQESYTCLVSAINVDLNDLKIQSVDSSKIDELIIANDNIYFVNSGEWTLPQ